MRVKPIIIAFAFILAFMPADSESSGKNQSEKHQEKLNLEKAKEDYKKTDEYKRLSPEEKKEFEKQWKKMLEMIEKIKKGKEIKPPKR